MIATVTVTFEAATPGEAATLVNGWTLTPGAEVHAAFGEEMPQPPQIVMVNVTAEPIIVGSDGTVTFDLPEQSPMP